MEDLEIEVLEEVESKTDKENEKSLILFNDDYNSFDHVINCLVNYCEHNENQAEQCAMLIHLKGKYTVKCGSFEKLKPIKEALQENGLTAIIS